MAKKKDPPATINGWEQVVDKYANNYSFLKQLEKDIEANKRDFRAAAIEALEDSGKTSAEFYGTAGAVRVRVSLPNPEEDGNRTTLYESAIRAAQEAGVDLAGLTQTTRAWVLTGTTAAWFDQLLEAHGKDKFPDIELKEQTKLTASGVRALQARRAEAIVNGDNERADALRKVLDSGLKAGTVAVKR